MGPYEVISPLGAGGMGEVCRARNSRLSREVAIKVLPSELSSDADRLSSDGLLGEAAGNRDGNGRDLQSRNGTYVSDKRIERPTKRANGDKIKIGAASLVFRSFRGLGTTQSEVAT